VDGELTTLKRCTICNQPVRSARFIDHETGAQIHPMCMAGWFSSAGPRRLGAAEPALQMKAPAAADGRKRRAA
jgi:hypothetical protein